jgi:hypothetical protein
MIRTQVNERQKLISKEQTAMEQELIAHLNYPADEWTPWDGDEFICWLIETGQVPPLDEEHPAFTEFQTRKAA